MRKVRGSRPAGVQEKNKTCVMGGLPEGLPMAALGARSARSSCPQGRVAIFFSGD